MSPVTLQPYCPGSTWLGLAPQFGVELGTEARAVFMLPFLPPQSVLKKRDQVQAEYEAKLEAVALRKEERPKVRGGPGRVGCPLGWGGLGAKGIRNPHSRGAQCRLGVGGFMLFFSSFLLPFLPNMHLGWSLLLLPGLFLLLFF